MTHRGRPIYNPAVFLQVAEGGLAPRAEAGTSPGFASACATFRESEFEPHGDRVSALILRTITEIARGVLPGHPQVWDDVQLRPYRIVIRWQVAATVLMALLGGLLDGRHGAISVLLGGAVVSTAAALSMLVASIGAGVSASPGGALLALLRAEAVKVAVIVLLLWVVFSSYKDVVVAGFIGSFVVSLGILAMAILVRESKHE